MSASVGATAQPAVPQFIVRTKNPKLLADFLAQFGATLDPLAAGELASKGGGAPLAKGGTTPKTVRGPTNKTGMLDLASRADHEHRLEVEVGTLAEGLVAARPQILFSGTNVTVVDDPGNDRALVRVAGNVGLGRAQSAAVPVVPAAEPITLVSVDVVTSGEEIEATFTDTAICAVQNDPASITYWIEVDGVTIPGTTGQVLLEGDPLDVNGGSLAMACHGITTGLAAGAHTVRVRAQAGLATNEPATGGGTLSVRQWSELP